MPANLRKRIGRTYFPLSEEADTLSIRTSCAAKLMKRPSASEPSYPRHGSYSAAQPSKKVKRPQCKICREPFDTLLFAVSVRDGKAHPLCAGLKAIGLEKLATTSGR